MNTYEVREVAKQVVEEIASRYPQFPPPGLLFDLPPEYRRDNGRTAFISRSMVPEVPANSLLVPFDEWVGPHSNPEDLRVVLAHEMGHWHQYHTDPHELFEGFEQIRLWQEGRVVASLKSKDSFEDYRLLPTEAYADRFGDEMLGRAVPLGERRLISARMAANKALNYLDFLTAA